MNRMMRSKIVRLAIVAALVAGCSSCSGGGGGRSGGACSSLIGLGSAVVETMGDGSAPTPLGGAKKIPPGVYLLTGWTVYPPATADPSRSRNLTMVVRGNTIEMGGTDSNTAAPVGATFSYSVSGTTIDSTWTCGGTGTFQKSFSISGDQVMIFNPRSGGVEVEIWTI